jgi:putative hydrolase of HD superfamily
LSSDVNRLRQQFEFIIETDELKQVLRQTVLIGDGRRENDAEHSWHLALMAVILVEHSAEPVDVLKVVKMVIIHDLVEIDAGDTFAYDEEGQRGKVDRERTAAKRIFALLPAGLSEELKELWEEFEARETAEARYANALDRLQPLLLNYHSGGATWRDNGVVEEQVIRRNQHIEDGAPALWRYAEQMIERAVDEGKLER